jgi:hypothetical protein
MTSEIASANYFTRKSSMPISNSLFRSPNVQLEKKMMQSKTFTAREKKGSHSQLSECKQ